MSTSIQYIVKARDNVGHQFNHTYQYDATEAQIEARGMPLLHEIMKTYRWDVLRAAPFRCVNCGSPAQHMLNNPVAYLADSDDRVVFNVALPHCRADACKKIVKQTVTQTTLNVGVGQDLAQGVSCTFTHPMPAHQFAEGWTPPAACVVCGDTKDLKRCKRCRVISYCSTSCQARQWPLHKAWCKRYAIQASLE